LLAGLDPVEQRQARRATTALADAKAMTFDACRDACVASHRAGWRSAKHAKQWVTTLATYVTPVFGHLPVAVVDTGLVLRVLEPMWATKSKTASRVRGRIEAVLDWAKARGYRAGENPARWRGHLDQLLPRTSKVRAVRHHPALPYDAVPAFMGELSQHRSISARMLEFTILTAARTSEVRFMRWCEVDTARTVWTVPASRMKGGREHRVPLTPRALAILAGLPRDGAYVFQRNGRPLSDVAMLDMLARMGRADLTVHGFRSTFRTWSAERTNFPHDAIEMSLAHIVGDETERAYQRGDLFEKRRRLMMTWAGYCSEPAGSGEVVQLTKKKGKESL
jgi:integrase